MTGTSYLSVKEVMVEHVVVGEFLLAVELSVSETSHQRTDIKESLHLKLVTDPDVCVPLGSVCVRGVCVQCRLKLVAAQNTP